MATIQNKLKKRWGFSRTVTGHSNCFVHRDGTATACTGHIHDSACEVVGSSLADYLKEGGIRVKIWLDEIVIEMFAKRPTVQQLATLQKIIRAGKFGFLTYSSGTRYHRAKSFRVITSRDLINCIEKKT